MPAPGLSGSWFSGRLFHLVEDLGGRGRMGQRGSPGDFSPIFRFSYLAGQPTVSENAQGRSLSTAAVSAQGQTLVSFPPPTNPAWVPIPRNTCSLAGLVCPPGKGRIGSGRVGASFAMILVVLFVVALCDQKRGLASRCGAIGEPDIHNPKDNSPLLSLGHF